jgi:hypothetical protein
MGNASRRRAEQQYAVERVNAQLLGAMHLTTGPGLRVLEAAE